MARKTKKLVWQEIIQAQAVGEEKSATSGTPNQHSPLSWLPGAVGGTASEVCFHWQNFF